MTVNAIPLSHFSKASLARDTYLSNFHLIFQLKIRLKKRLGQFQFANFLSLFLEFFANFLRKDFFKFFEIKKPPSNHFEEGIYEPLAGIEPATY
jgi:hypothetical protein